MTTGAETIPDVCPACGGYLHRVEVDIGVGTQYGPWHCMDCVWQQPEEDFGLIDNPEEEELPW